MSGRKEKEFLSWKLLEEAEELTVRKEVRKDSGKEKSSTRQEIVSTK